MVRDARINQIGEGSNEVLTSFIALVGMRGPRSGMVKPRLRSSRCPTFSCDNHSRRIRQFLSGLTANDDKAVLAAGDSVLQQK
jgi:hypothetical protein